LLHCSGVAACYTFSNIETDHQTELGPECKSAKPDSLISVCESSKTWTWHFCSVTVDDLMPQAENKIDQLLSCISLSAMHVTLLHTSET
jgi:hypothetical protein